MPNIFFMVIQFFYLTALTVWIGGIISIAFITAPVIFNKLSSRGESGDIVGEILRRFDRIVYICISILVVTGIIRYLNWETFSPWIGIRYFAILIMSLSVLFTSLFISPRMSYLKTKIPSFDNSDNSPYTKHRKSFKRLHKISFGCMLINLGFGLIVILLS